jgi:hypothetical protein
MKFGKLWSCLALGAAVLVAFPTPGESAKKYKEIAVADGGSVSGKVTFEGTCGTGEREVVWVDVKDGALRGVFVFIDNIAEGKKWPEPEGGAYLIDQKDCRFTPWAQVVKRGPITIRNSDHGVLHNINTREMIGVEKGRVVKRTMFNFGQPDPGDIQQDIKPRRSAFIAMNCEAHNFMFGFMMAPLHPYAVVVGEDGSYSLDGVPPGEYTLKAWHPRFGIKKTKITVEAGAAAAADFAFAAE